ncbi:MULTISPECIES: GNAT family protein [unclassified Nocardia]|uniref:GNAT family N-acetyltransferase n=1 Tax=unclassified Nocardia TaxID=2637762 RepID=UPI0024A8BADF|nr:MULTISPECIES: GNAT family protein [unclassified Nocardia]
MIWPVHQSADCLEDGEVSLRRYNPTCASELFEALNDERVWEHIPRSMPRDSDEVNADILARMAEGRWITYAIRAAGVVVGRSSLIWDPSAPDGVEIGGTQLSPVVWGTGVNMRAKRMLITAVFDQGAEWVTFRTDERNARSAAAIGKLGATDLGVHPDTFVRRDGSVRRSRFFRLERPGSRRRSTAEGSR